MKIKNWDESLKIVKKEDHIENRHFFDFADFIIFFQNVKGIGHKKGRFSNQNASVQFVLTTNSQT